MQIWQSRQKFSVKKNGLKICAIWKFFYEHGFLLLIEMKPKKRERLQMIEQEMCVCLTNWASHESYLQWKAIAAFILVITFTLFIY